PKTRYKEDREPNTKGKLKGYSGSQPRTVILSSPARNTCHKAATTLLKPPLEGTCRKIRSPPLFTDMQDAAETLNSIHRKHTGKQGAEIRHHTSDVGERRDPTPPSSPPTPPPIHALKKQINHLRSIQEQPTWSLNRESIERRENKSEDRRPRSRRKTSPA
ncbi:hypothetical protein HID58_057314, partial [Brassica napus]